MLSLIRWGLEYLSSIIRYDVQTRRLLVTYCLMYVRIVKSWTFWDFLLVEQFFLLVYKISKKNNTRTIIPLDDVTHGLHVTSLVNLGSDADIDLQSQRNPTSTYHSQPHCKQGKWTTHTKSCLWATRSCHEMIKIETIRGNTSPILSEKGNI